MQSWEQVESKETTQDAEPFHPAHCYVTLYSYIVLFQENLKHGYSAISFLDR